MALRTIRDRRLTGDDNLTNILSGTATTGTGQVEQQDQQGAISGVPKDATAPGAAAPTTTQSAQQQNQQQAQQQQVKVATKAPKQPARSGMFTNIKQYMEKNKPVIEKMGQQAGGQFATTAEKVRQQADIQQKSYQERLKESQEAVQSQLTGGQQAIEDIISPQQNRYESFERIKPFPTIMPVTYPSTPRVLTPSEIAVYEEKTGKKYEPPKIIEPYPTTRPDIPDELLVRKKTEDTTSTTPIEQPATLADYGKAAENLAASTSALNLEEQIKEASKLQKQASGILSDAGRRDLLRDVFGRGTRQYTSGAQALDNLLLAASPEAGRRLKETVTSASRGLEDITRQQQAGTQAFQELQKQAAGVGDILGRQSEQALQQQFGDLETSTQQFKEERQAYLQDLVKKGTEALKKNVKNLSDNFAGLSKEQLLKKMGATYTGSASNRRLFGNTYGIKKSDVEDFYKKNNLETIFGSYQNFISDLDLSDYYGKSDHYSYGVKNQDIGHTNPIKQKLLDMGKNASSEALKLYSEHGENAIHPFIAKQIKEATGIDYYDLIKDSDIEEGKYYGYSDEEIARINALKKLQGRTDFITPSEDYTSLEDLQSIDYFDKLLKSLS